jgi:hypothetical protein
MTSSQYVPYVQGYTRVTMAGTEGLPSHEAELIPKTGLSSDWSLQPDSMKSESLVIAEQHAAVNTFPGLVHTARHAMGVGSTRSHLPNPASAGMGMSKVRRMTGAKS